MFLDRHDLETVTPADEPQQTDSPAAADVAIVRRKDHPEVKGAESVRFQLTPRKARQIFAIAASMCDAVDSELEDDEINLRITALRIAVQLYMRRHVRPNVRVDALRLFGDDLIRKDKQVGDVLAHLNSGTVDALLRDGEVGDDDGQG
jgi:hypothetical protein